jgi:hypothetical protein
MASRELLQGRDIKFEHRSIGTVSLGEAMRFPRALRASMSCEWPWTESVVPMLQRVIVLESAERACDTLERDCRCRLGPPAARRLGTLKRGARSVAGGRPRSGRGVPRRPAPTRRIAEWFWRPSGATRRQWSFRGTSSVTTASIRNMQKGAPATAVRSRKQRTLRVPLRPRTSKRLTSTMIRD